MSNCLAFSWQSHHDVCLRNESSIIFRQESYTYLSPPIPPFLSSFPSLSPFLFHVCFPPCILSPFSTNHSSFDHTACCDIYSIVPCLFQTGCSPFLFKPLSHAWSLIFCLSPSIGLSSPQLNALTYTHTDSSIGPSNTQLSNFPASVNCHIVISRIVMVFQVSSLVVLDVILCGTARLIYRHAATLYHRDCGLYLNIYNAI